MAAIVKRGNSYSVVYYVDEKGIRKQKWESYHSEAEALRRKELVERYYKIRKERCESQIVTIEQLMWEYVRLYGKTKWSLSMYTFICSLIWNYIVPHFGKANIHELSPRMVSELYRSFMNQQRYSDLFHKNTDKKVTANTLKSIHKLLHSAFEQAVLWEFVERNPFHKAALPKSKSNKQPFLSPEQIHKLLFCCQELWLKLCIELAFVCTLRKGELLALTWDDVNWEQNCIRINKTLCRVSREAMLELDERDILYKFPTNKENSTVMVLKTPKTEASNRIVYLTPTVQQGLIDMKNNQKNTAYENNPRLIFAYEDGRPLQGAVLTKHFQKLLEICDMPKVTFHSLRHSSITYKLILTGGDIKAVQGDSGHAQADMITELYGRILDKNRKIGAERFESAFFKNAGNEL